MLAFAAHFGVPGSKSGHFCLIFEDCLRFQRDSRRVLELDRDIIVSTHDQVALFSIINDNLAQKVHCCGVRHVELSGIGKLSNVKVNGAVSSILLLNSATSSGTEIKLVNVLPTLHIECSTVITNEHARGNTAHVLVQ